MLSNKLFTTALAASLMTAGTFATMKPAQAAFIPGSELQLNSSLFFYDADPGAAVELNALFSENGQFGGGPPYAPVGDYGTALLLATSTGSFAPYFPTPPSQLEILSVTLPSLTPTTVGNTRVFVGPGGNGPQAGFTDPFLILTNPAVPGSPVRFFLETITEFTDNLPSPNPTKTFNIGGFGTFIDTMGNALGAAQINGTFTIANSVLVDIATGATCTTEGGTCVRGNNATFGGTFIAQEVPPPVPEPSTVATILALGVLGGGSKLLKLKKRV